MMNEGQKNRQANEEESYGLDYEASDEISLGDLFFRIWRRKIPFILATLAITLVILVVGGLVYLFQTHVEVAQLRFELQFDGVDKGEYPNGLKFSTSDMLSVPVLNRVYTENDIEKYMTLSEFKGALGVIQTNDQIRLLEYEYAAKLSDRKLSVEERERIEAEFLEKKKNAMSPIYILRFSHKGLISIPGGLAAEVLNDILRTWAEYADRVKGALKYRTAIVSPNVMDKSILTEEGYLVSLDILRTVIERIQEDINKLMDIPGSKTIKIGESEISLNDLKYRLLDLEKFRLSPVRGMIRQTGISKDKEISIGYIRNRLSELELKKSEALAKKEVYDAALKKYVLKGADAESTETVSPSASLPLGGGTSGQMPAMIPQFGASFLNSLIELGQEQSDAAFRQKITQQAIDSGIEKVELEAKKEYYLMILDRYLDSHKVSNPQYVKAVKNKIDKVYADAFKQIIDTIEQLNQIYLALSKYNLEPQAQLYSILEPVTIQVSKAISPKRLLMFVVLAWVLAEAILLFVLLIPTPSNRQKLHQG